MPSPKEAARLQALARYNVLDTPPEASFDRLTRLAASFFDVPIALITFVEAERQWFKSCYGTDLRETSREISFCTQAIEHDGVLVVEDAAEDARFAQNPLVTGREGFRFYAGAPLRTPDGHALGTLCLLAHAPRTFSDEEQRRLADLAATAMDELELRREVAARQKTEASLRAERRLARSIVDGLPGIFYLFDAAGRMRRWNRNFEKASGYSAAEIAALPATAFVRDEDAEAARAAAQAVLHTGHATVEMPLLTKDGRLVPYVCTGALVTVDGEPCVAGTGFDVTERLQNEERLRMVETAVAHAQDGIVIAKAHPDERGGREVLYVNRAFTEQTGYSPEEMIGRPTRTLHGPDTDARAVKTIGQALQRGEPVRTDLLCYRKDGYPFWADLSIVPVRNAKGTVTHWTSIARDITPRKAAEDALRRSEAKYRALFETAADAIIIFEPEDETILAANAKASALYGIPLDEIVGTSVKAFTRDVASGEEMIQRFMEGTLQRGIETTHQRRDGTPVHVRISASKIHFGGREAILSINHDITERKRIEEALRQSEQQYRSVVENVSDVVFQTDAEGRWTFLNQAWSEITGYTLEESLGRCFVDFLHPENRRADLLDFEGHAAAGNLVNTEVRYRTRGGEALWLRVRAKVLRDPATGALTGTSGTLSDITSSVRFKAEREARQRAEELLQLKTTFLNNISHELRTPLTGIIGFAEVLREEMDGPLQEFAGRIIESGRRLQGTLNSVLDLASLESGGLTLEPRLTDVAAEVEGAVRLLMPLAERKGLDLEVAAHAPDARAWADPNALHRIVNNLVGNAIKFTKEGRVTVGICADDTRVRLCAEDTGIGISEAFRPHLFEDFRQESSGLSRSYEGSGLGLPITKRLVNLMGGTLEVESEQGRGSVFTVSLPRPLHAAPAEETAAGETAAPAGRPLKR